ncbi:hypothetical protein MKZ38_002522 [Zalerion maritima]|uniref:Uncharacterized protein n=1 Tax=Zalerion maritima TaxID=339359 RepID=A0AAD5WQR7_9PEZI|nr:hypothetical protein MKZ38_002522 [Zalerion maritima]
MAQNFLAILILCSILVGAEARYRSTGQFQEWYPEYGPIFTRIRDDNCSAEFQNYLDGVNNISIEKLESQGGSEHSRFVQPVMLCILDHTNEYVKAGMSSAQVILGITPSILSIMGPSSEEFATLSVVGMRPILSSLLAVAAPSVFSSRAFEMVQPRDVLGSGRGSSFSNGRITWKRRALVLGEYLLVLSALGNTGLLSYQAGIRTANPISGNFVFFPAVWAAMAVPIHVTAVVLVRLRARLVSKNPPGFWARELCLPSEPASIFVQWGEKTKGFVAGGWLHSIFIIGHLIFGTVIFSSLQFIGQADAIGVLGRYMASVLVCRMVLMYELALLGKRHIAVDMGEKAYREVPAASEDDGRHSLVQPAIFEGRTGI